MTVPKCINKNNLRTTEAKIVQELKNNVTRLGQNLLVLTKSVYCSERVLVFREAFYIVVRV